MRSLPAIVIGTLSAISPCQLGLAASIRAVAVEAGITPEMLAAADLAAASSPILQTLQGAQQLRDLIESRRTAVGVAAQLAEHLGRELISSSDEAMRQSFRDAVEAEQAARASLAASIEEIRNVALAQVDPTRRLTLDRLRLASSFRLPLSFGVLCSTTEELSVLELAMRAEERAVTEGGGVPPEYAQLLNQIRNNPTVILADQRLITAVPAIEAIFNQYDDASP